MTSLETIREKFDGSVAHRLSAAERARRLAIIKEGRLAGKSWGQLSDEIGRSKTALMYLAKKAGLSCAAQDDVSLVSFLRACFVYDTDTGALLRRGGGRKKGQPFGSQRKDGYWYAYARGHSYPLHHLVWAFHRGELPSSEMLDHINRNPADNRIENLREATPQSNSYNSSLPKNNKSGLKGVRLRYGRWYAQILCEGRAHHLGSFACRYEAARAYDAKARELHGEAAATNEDLGLYEKAAA